MSNAFPSRAVTDFWAPPEVSALQAMLPQYEVLELLGRGGMGAVYKARQKSLNRLVAIKILPSTLADDALNFADRFKQEAQMIAQLSHPVIIHVYDFGTTEGGLLYFVMEYVDGKDVAAVLATEGKLGVAQATGIADAVCQALHYAHSQGVIHRDIKPANVLISNEGQVKVADFGLAKMTDPAQASGLTRTNVAMGTQEFAAPEMLTPGATVDHRADLYSLGVMLYQMLTGEIPRVMFKLPSFRRPELGTRFDALLCRALETDPTDRYQTVKEFHDALTEAAVMPAKPAAFAPAPLGVTATMPQPRKAKWPLLIAASLLALVVSGWFVWKNWMGGKNPVTAQAPTSSSSEPNVIRLWDAPEKIPKETAVRWENGAVVLGDDANKGQLNHALPRSRDAILRADIQTNPNAEYAQLRLRYNWTQGPGDFYRLILHQRTISLSVSVLGADKNIRNWVLPRAYGPDEWARLELRAVGDELTASLDGKVLGSVHDDSLSGAGSIMVVAHKNGRFRNIVYVPLDKPGATKFTTKPAVEPRWRDWLAPKLKDHSLPEAWTYELEGASTEEKFAGQQILPSDTTDAAVRLTYVIRASHGMLLTVRERGTDESRQSFKIEDQGDKLQVAAYGPAQAYRVLETKPLSNDWSRTTDRTLGLSMKGELLEVTINGTVVATVHDSAPSSGATAVVLNKGVLLKKVETQSHHSK